MIKCVAVPSLREEFLLTGKAKIETPLQPLLPLSDKTAGFINTSLAMGVASVFALIAVSHIMRLSLEARRLCSGTPFSAAEVVLSIWVK